MRRQTRRDTAERSNAAFTSATIRSTSAAGWLVVALILSAGAASAQAQSPEPTITFTQRLVTLTRGDSLAECEACPEMIAIPGGAFEMGSPREEPGRLYWEGPQRRVTIQPFAIGKYAVTFAEWDACAADGFCRPVPTGGEKDDDTDRGWGRDQQPVIEISWNDIKGEAGDGKKGFLAWLNAQVEGSPYRLPTEAEWEYAARGGTTTAFWLGDKITPWDANYDGGYAYAGGGGQGASREKTLPVRSFEPNPFGLYQVHGNVWEWVEDCWADWYRGAPTDGSSRTDGDCSKAALRGGSWYDVANWVRSASRQGSRRENRGNTAGFRIARTL